MRSILLAAAILTGSQARADDTYNFYFQKAPGPVTVNQGSAPAQPNNLVVPPAAPPPAAAAPAATVVTVAPAEENTPRRFFLSLGYALSNSYNGIANRYDIARGEKDAYLSNQYSVKGEYDLSERLSLTADLYKLVREAEPTPIAYGDFGVGTTRTLSREEMKSVGTMPASQKNVFDFAAGVSFHFVRMRATTLSLMGGMITVPRLHYEDVVRQSPTRGLAIPKDGVQHALMGYGGIRLRLLADQVWGLEASFRSLIGVKQGIAQAGLTFAL